jgi:5-formyltetrahydrofolate cyclo-ligase
VIPAADDWPAIRAWRKAERDRLVAVRVALPRAERDGANAAIGAALEQLTRRRGGRLIGFYWPFKGEFDARPLARRLVGEGLRFALPVVVEKGAPLIFREWRPGIRMVPRIWQIPVPADGPAVAPDLVWVPLLGFDSAGYRLGYGGGYYDRTLGPALPRPFAIGIGYERVRLASIRPQPHDIPMDAIVTEAGVVFERPTPNPG